jgi:hypothetical protein
MICWGARPLERSRRGQAPQQCVWRREAGRGIAKSGFLDRIEAYIGQAIARLLGSLCSLHCRRQHGLSPIWNRGMIT